MKRGGEERSSASTHAFTTPRNTSRKISKLLRFVSRNLWRVIVVRAISNRVPMRVRDNDAAAILNGSGERAIDRAVEHRKTREKKQEKGQRGEGAGGERTTKKREKNENGEDGGVSEACRVKSDFT